MHDSAQELNLLMSEYKNKLLIKSLGPFFLEKESKTTRKQVFFNPFLTFWGCLGTPMLTQKGT
jgi:hypothetical protein